MQSVCQSGQLTASYATVQSTHVRALSQCHKMLTWAATFHVWSLKQH